MQKGEIMERFELTKEHKKRFAECKTPEECIAYAKEIGYELTGEEIEKINGGNGISNLFFPGMDKCPRCGSTSITVDRPDPLLTICRCNECGYEWDF